MRRMTWIAVALLLTGRAWAAETAAAKTNAVSEQPLVNQAEAAQTIAAVIAKGAAGEKLPAGFQVELDWSGQHQKFTDMQKVCQLLRDAKFTELATAPRDMKKAVPADAPCQAIYVWAGESVYLDLVDCFCEPPLADEAMMARFRELHGQLMKLVVPPTPEELARKAAIDEIRRQLATGQAGQKLPETFKVEIELNAVGRSVAQREHWVFTPTTVSRLARVKRGDKWAQEPSATTDFTKIKELCDALWNGEFLQLAGAGEWICGRGGSGPFFFGTPFIGGERMITVSVRDHKLALGRSCWRATRDNDTDRESRFTGLYTAIKNLAPSPNAAIAAAIAQGAETGVVPAGFDVVIETFGSKADSGKREGLDKIVSEAWRFTPAKVETFTANTVAKSREVNEMKAVCQALQSAGFMTLARAPRSEPFAGALTFDAIACNYGWRYVRVSLDNQALYLGEGTTWPVFTDEKQAEQVRALYETLRKLAQGETP